MQVLTDLPYHHLIGTTPAILNIHPSPFLGVQVLTDLFGRDPDQGEFMQVCWCQYGWMCVMVGRFGEWGVVCGIMGGDGCRAGG